MKNRCVALLLVLSVLAGASPAQIYVDDDAPGDPLPFDRALGDPSEDGSAEHPFDSIQEAIDAAEDGDTIIVAPGHYLSPDPWEYDEIDFGGKSIRLVGSAPTDFSVADQTVLCGVVIFRGTEDPDALLQGFKVQNHGHGGILGNHTQATVSHCIISGNGPCGSTVVKDVRGPVANCLIVDNTTFHDCGVGPVVSGCPTIVNCTIAHNYSGISFTNDSIPAVGRMIGRVTLRNCIIHSNAGAQLLYRWDRSLPATAHIEYCLIQDWSTLKSTVTGVLSDMVQEGDPCFVRLGHWVQGASVQPPARRPPDGPSSRQPVVRDVLVEGDYHLRSAGWRWTEQEMHGSHWYFDTVTSPAIDAGDPLDSLDAELERAPGDPEGRYGVNHAVNLGAYGGTAQASLAPTDGDPPGLGAVDLRDYWPFTEGYRWSVHSPQGTAWHFRVTTHLNVNGFPVYPLATSNARDWATNIYCVYVDHMLYMAQETVTLNLLLENPQAFQAQYPQYLTVGAMIETPYDPFMKNASPSRRSGSAQVTPEYRLAIVVRGTLDEVLAGTAVDRTGIVIGPTGSWPDVIALRDMNHDGTPGEPITIFARGFGPLMLAGQPVEQAVRGYIVYSAADLPAPARR